MNRDFFYSTQKSDIKQIIDETFNVESILVSNKLSFNYNDRMFVIEFGVCESAYVVEANKHFYWSSDNIEDIIDWIKTF